MINLPIYRAKRIDSNEYVEGFLKNCTDTGLDVFWIQSKEFIDYKIEIDTLSIHFPNMIDVKGDKIFASLHENGKGGDILFDMEYEYTLSFDGLKFILQGLFSQSSFNEFDSWEAFDVIGIEEWKSPK